MQVPDLIPDWDIHFKNNNTLEFYEKLYAHK